MVNTHSSQIEKRRSKKIDETVEMAARLFAELFYKQFVAERGQKNDARGQQIDSRRRHGLQSNQ